jgi:hypothetical protein
MDDDVREALDELQESIGKLSKARTPAQQQQARETVREERADLEEVLRREGYSFTRKDLEKLREDREFEKFRERYARLLSEDDPDESVEEEEETEGKPKPKPKPKPTGSKDDTEEWV